MAKDIESLVKDFAKDMDKVCADLRKARMDKTNKDDKKPGDATKDDKKKGDKKGDELPVITFALDPSSATKGRTPEEQAAQVAAGKSWVCWGAHMGDSARHVIMKVDGKATWDPKKALGDDFDEFEKKWAKAMKDNGLKNAKGGDGWYEGDAFHLELPESKLDKSDKRVAACFEEYAKLTRKDGKSKNDKFEKAYAKDLAKYISKYEKDQKKK